MKTPEAADHRIKLPSRVTVLSSASAVLLLVAAGRTTATALPAHAANWTPPAASYAASAPVHTTVTVDDGVKIAVEVVYPTDPTSGARASGPFPVLLTQNPYGAQRSDPTDSGTYFVQRGYIYVASAVRGTGDSGGQVDWFGDRQGKDGADLVDWAAHTLSGSNGKVGLDGCSYLGVDQWFTAAAVGKNSALKAITPFCTDSDFYNDLTGNGGVPTLRGRHRAGRAARPGGRPRHRPAVGDHRPAGLGRFTLVQRRLLAVPERPEEAHSADRGQQHSGTDRGFYWNDLFPGGNLGAYVSAQNASYHRPLTDPISSDEPVTGRYQAIVGPWTHGEHVNEATLQGIRLEWFDTWLKNAPTGMANTSAPLHVFENGANTWVDSAAWPLSSDARTYYLGNGSLTPGKPTDEGSDTLSWSAATAANTLTYTTAPLSQAALLNGPTDVTLYARSTTPETELSAKLSIVAPDGTVTKQADGILLGSQRALDTQESWYGDNGTLIKPSHPFTQASQHPVTPGQTTRYDISLLSNFTRIPAGYRIQISINSQPLLPTSTSPSPRPRRNWRTWPVASTPSSAPRRRRPSSTCP